MAVCFLCDAKLFGDQTRLCSSITTPHSNIPYPEKVAELMGDDFVVVVSPADHMCKTCTSLLTRMDTLEHNLTHIRNSMLSTFRNKRGSLPPDQPVQTLDVINGHLKTDDLEIGQEKVPSGLNRENTPLATPLKKLKPNEHFHMCTHMNKEENANQPAEALAPIKATPHRKKRIFRCQLCSAFYDSRINCLDHIQKNHKTTVESASKSFKNKASEELKLATISEKSQDEEQTETMADVNDHQLNKGNVNIDMMLNDNLSTGATGEQDESQSMDVDNGTQEDTMNTQEDTMNSQEETMKTNNKTVDEKVTNGSEENNKASDLDVESMSAAIHYD